MSRGRDTNRKRFPLSSFLCNLLQWRSLGQLLAVMPSDFSGMAVVFQTLALFIDWGWEILHGYTRFSGFLFRTKMTDKIRTQMQQITLGVDDPEIELPDNLCEEAINANEFSLIGQPINPRKQNIRAMMNTLPRIWGVGDEVQARLLADMMIQFIFPSDESLQTILRRGPWSFNEWMVALAKWTPNALTDDLLHINFWVQIRGIPIQFLNLPIVVHIGHRLGHYLDTDFSSEGSQMAGYVRVKLRWPISSPLRFQRRFRFGGQSVVLSFIYEKLKNFCFTCGRMTHDAGECEMAVGSPSPPTDNDDNSEDDGDTENDPTTDTADLRNVKTPTKQSPTAPTYKGDESASSSTSKKRKLEANSTTLGDGMGYSEQRQISSAVNTHEPDGWIQRSRVNISESKHYFIKPYVIKAANIDHEFEIQASATKSEGSVGHKPPDSQ